MFEDFFKQKLWDDNDCPSFDERIVAADQRPCLTMCVIRHSFALSLGGKSQFWFQSRRYTEEEEKNQVEENNELKITNQW
jgi:hypothetical protein